MKTARTVCLAILLSMSFAGTSLAAQAPVGLGTAQSFAILSGQAITNTGITRITGDVGIHPGKASDVTGFSSVVLTGATYYDDPGGVALQAKNDLETAYNDAAGRLPVTRIGTQLDTAILKAGVYDSASGTFDLRSGGVLTLDAEGDSNAVFIFHTVTTLITGPGTSVVLINSAQACNVYWKVGSSATLDTTTSFKGNILALTSIGLLTGATLEGRALARNGAVTMDSNVITRPTCATPVTTNPTTPAPALVTTGTTPAPVAANAPSGATGPRSRRGSSSRGEGSGPSADLPRTGGLTIPALPSALLAVGLILLGRPMARMNEAQAALQLRAFTYKPRHKRSRLKHP
ncbi:MAG TPA: ice-binding family protein [Actinomycetota bacterium]|nr:ice-binding family protein [Actinomycetota bacterium]